MSDGGASRVFISRTELCAIFVLYPDVVWFLLIGHIYGIVGLVYQYGHASEVVDSITVESDIDNFDKL